MSRSRIPGSPAGAFSGTSPAFAMDVPVRAATGEAETPCNTAVNKIVHEETKVMTVSGARPLAIEHAAHVAGFER
jgi:hypothetical protein